VGSLPVGLSVVLLVGRAYRDHDLVFAMPDGRPLHPERFSREFTQTVERSPLPRIRLHDLRHTWATLALQAGVQVQERLGHSTIAVTLDTYSHVIPAMQSDAAKQGRRPRPRCGRLSRISWNLRWRSPA